MNKVYDVVYECHDGWNILTSDECKLFKNSDDAIEYFKILCKKYQFEVPEIINNIDNCYVSKNTLHDRNISEDDQVLAYIEINERIIY